MEKKMRFDVYNINEEPKKEEPIVLVQPAVNETELKKEEPIVSVQSIQPTIIPKMEEPKKDINICIDCPKNTNCEFKPREELIRNKKITMITTFCKWKDGKDYIEPDKK